MTRPAPPLHPGAPAGADALASGPARGTDFAREYHTAHRRIAIGPAHPAAAGARLVTELDGERIVGLEPDVGWVHRGFEKECEAHGWGEIAFYAERLNYEASILSSTAYCEAVEKLLGLALPERCQWLRVLAGELSRIAHHLGRVADTARVLEAATAAQYAVGAREQVWDLLESLSGARVLHGWVRLGGVARDLPPDFASRWGSARQRLEAALAELDVLLGRNRSFVRRLEGVAALSAEDCLAWSITGPLARASGVARDLRRDEPSAVYAALDFDVVVARSGDDLARYRVYLEEIRQSVRIVSQCLERIEAMGPGAVMADDPRLVPAAWDGTPETAEAIALGPEVPAGETYHAIESANGELGFYVVSDGGRRPARLRCRPPSFYHLQPLDRMLRGACLSDLAPTVALLGVVAAECDR